MSKVIRFKEKLSEYKKYLIESREVVRQLENLNKFVSKMERFLYFIAGIILSATIIIIYLFISGNI